MSNEFRGFCIWRIFCTSATSGLGDIVIIQSDKVPRQKWRMGRVITLYPGKDSIVRAANVKTLDAAGRNITLKRSIVHLYPLEIRGKSL